jgi:large subunit ribosomal protein L22
MEARAIARYVSLAPRKASIVADLVRHKNVESALEILRFTNKAGATFLEKVMKSALANANQMADMDIDNLYVKNIDVGNGPIRYGARYRGRLHVNRIRKRRCHITVILDDGAE